MFDVSDFLAMAGPSAPEPSWRYPDQVPRAATIDRAVTGAIPATVRGLLTTTHLPTLLGVVFRRAMAGELSPDEAAALAPRLWMRCAPTPATAAPPEEWRALWTAAGYCDDGIPAPRPTSPVMLYRGSVREHSRGWCWTPSRAYALMVSRQNGGSTWATECSPGSILGRFPCGQPDPRGLGAQMLEQALGRVNGLDAADEFVIDPEMLGPIRAWTPQEIASCPEWDPGHHWTGSRPGTPDAVTGMAIMAPGLSGRSAFWR